MVFLALRATWPQSLKLHSRLNFCSSVAVSVRSIWSELPEAAEVFRTNRPVESLIHSNYHCVKNWEKLFVFEFSVAVSVLKMMKEQVEGSEVQVEWAVGRLVVGRRLVFLVWNFFQWGCHECFGWCFERYFVGRKFQGSVGLVC